MEGPQQEEEEELEEGPPPGFQCSMPTLQKLDNMDQDDDDGDDDDDDSNGDIDDEEDDDDELKGPPPGFSTPPALPSDVDMGSKEYDTDDDDGPPPGWHAVTPPPPLPSKTPPLTTASSDIGDVKVKNDLETIEDEDDGPPPGWQLIPPKPQLPSGPALPSSPAVPCDIEMASRQKDIGDRSKVHPIGSQCAPVPESSVSPSPQVPLPLAAAVTSENGDNLGDNQGLRSKRQSVSPSQPLPPSTHRAPLLSEMGQLVCGTCRQLLSYPRGAKYVQCSPCQTVNLVLEASQVGQVKCGGCSVLLMYPYGSPAVRCSSCRFVTDIGSHNSRPPLSEQQARQRPPFSRVH